MPSRSRVALALPLSLRLGLGFGIGLGLLALATGCSKLTEPAKQEAIAAEPATAEAKQVPAASAAPSAPPAPAVPEGKLEITDVTVGKGPEAKDGDLVRVHYVGTLTDGKQFDANKDGDKPFEFELGKGRVIKGWDEGVKGMKPGGKRKLKIPSHMGYGARGAGRDIPPNATLLFDVELIEIVGAKGAPDTKAKGADAGAPKKKAP